MKDKDLKIVISEINKIKQSVTPEDAFTTRQLVEASGYGRDKANDLLRTALELGLCVYIGDIQISNRCNRQQFVPAYKWTTADTTTETKGVGDDNAQRTKGKTRTDGRARKGR